MAEADVASRQLAQFLLEEPHQLPLLALHAIGMIGVARQHGQIERRNRPGLPIAKLPGRRLQSHLDHAGHDAELVQQIQRRGMERRSAQLHHELRLGRNKHGGNAAAPQRQGRGKTHRPGTDNNHAIVRHPKRAFPRCAFSVQAGNAGRRTPILTDRCWAQNRQHLRLDDRPASSRRAPDNGAMQDRCRNLTPHVNATHTRGPSAAKVRVRFTGAIRR